jgi:hypothetical protein
MGGHCGLVSRGQRAESFLDGLAEKYASKPKKGKAKKK